MGKVILYIAAPLILITLLIRGKEALVNDKIFNVYNYGAKGDGITNDTRAIQSAINDCRGTGGTVLLEKGTFLSSTLEMASDMTLCIDSTAILLGVPFQGNIYNFYPEVIPPYETRTHQWAVRSLIHGYKLRDFTITGGGTIDLQGQSWKEIFIRENLTVDKRPFILLFHRCKNITVDNLNLQNTVGWCSAYDQCESLVVSNLEIYGDVIENNDGINIIDCSDVKVINNKIWADDDNICLKSMCEVGIKDVLIQGNILYSGRANGIKLGTDSSGPVENIKVINNKIFYAGRAGLAWEAVDGTNADGLYVNKLEMVRVSVPVFIIVANRGRGGFPLGSIKNVRLENLRVFETSHTGICITGMPESKIENLIICDSYFEMGGAWKLPTSEPGEAGKLYPESDMFGILPSYGFYVRHAQNVTFEHIKIGYLRGDIRPWLATKNVDNLVRKDVVEIGKIPPQLFNSPEWYIPFKMDNIFK